MLVHYYSLTGNILHCPCSSEFHRKMEFLYSCLHPKVYHEKLAPIHESMKETCVPVQLVHDFWHMFFSYDLVYTTGGAPDFIVVLLIICYHWNLIRLFRTVLTKTYDLPGSYQCAIFITKVYFIVVLILHNFFLPSNY